MQNSINLLDILEIGLFIIVAIALIDMIIGIIKNRKEKNKKKKYIIELIVLILIIFFGFLVVAYNSAQITMDYKPIIYLYPTEETEVSVNLGYSDKITCSYPKYTTGWNVLAKQNGDLIDLDSGRNLYSLYYESKNVVSFEVKEDGFIVKGTEVAKFLEEKLAILGLTERESEEFIVYWLPKLQENEYNYIRFAIMEEINANMPLKFSVKPDTLIRVLMTYKGLDNPIDVKEQKLEKTERTGFVAVEWGGTEIN